MTVISLVTDSAADVPANLIERYQIQVAPALVVIDGKPYRDGIDLTRAEFYRRLPAFHPLPTTAIPAAGEFESIYQSLPDGPILSIHTASTLSGFYNAARVGADSLGGRVTVVDSGSLSLGVGWQVITAAEVIAAGSGLLTALEAIAATRRRLQVVAVLDTVDNLRRSGRISLLRASLAGMLQIKPLIQLVDGSLTVLAQNRTLKKSLADFIARLKRLGRLERLGVMYTDNAALADGVCEALAGQCSAPPLVAQAAPAIGTHIGPNAVAVAVVKYKP